MESKEWLYENGAHHGDIGRRRHTLARHMKHRPGLFCTGLCADSGGDDSSAVLTVSSLLFSCSLSCCGDAGASAGKLFEGGGGGVVADTGCLSKLLLLIGVDDGAGLASVIAMMMMMMIGESIYYTLCMLINRLRCLFCSACSRKHLEHILLYILFP